MMQQKITSKTFKYVEKASSAVYSLEILEGRFKGVIFTFGKVDLNEDKENDQLGVSFQFSVEEGNRRYSKDDLMESIKFKTFLGKVLRFIFEEEFGEYDECSKADIKESL